MASDRDVPQPVLVEVSGQSGTYAPSVCRRRQMEKLVRVGQAGSTAADSAVRWSAARANTQYDFLNGDGVSVSERNEGEK